MCQTQKLLLVDTQQALVFRYRLDSVEKLSSLSESGRRAVHVALPRFGGSTIVLTRNERFLLVQAP